MGTTRVYVVHCVNGQTLDVVVDKKRVPMDEFLQGNTPVQVSGLTPNNPGHSTEMSGLMIAEEIEKPKKKTIRVG